MSLYLTIAEGRSPATARPILATHDPEVLRAVAKVLERRMRAGTETKDAPQAGEGTDESESTDRLPGGSKGSRPVSEEAEEQ